jgi:hypothetical protein
MTCICDGRCRKPPYTCSGQHEPDFLTAAQTNKHRLAYQQGKTNWSSPFHPWVVRSWARLLDTSGGGARADQVRQNILEGSKIANNATMSTSQKIQKLNQLSKAKGKPTTKLS